jgi:hypothetical protein
MEGVCGQRLRCERFEKMKGDKNARILQPIHRVEK